MMSILDPSRGGDVCKAEFVSFLVDSDASQKLPVQVTYKVPHICEHFLRHWANQVEVVGEQMVEEVSLYFKPLRVLHTGSSNGSSKGPCNH